VAGFTKVVVDEVAVDVFMHTEVDPALARVLGPHLAGAAKGRAPVYSGDETRDHVPGLLRDSIMWDMGPTGHLEIRAVWYDLFLELPARHITHPIRTLEQILGDLPIIL
jgi:hypothetical protein